MICFRDFDGMQTGQIYVIIDLGCGSTKEAGAVGVDNAQLPVVDIVHDLLEFPYPFEDKCAEKIYLKHVIEHFDFVDIQAILNEVHRILQVDGIVEIRVPHVFCVAAWADPTHRKWFSFGSANFWDKHGAKAYYQEVDAIWELVSTQSRVTLFNWKRYRLRQLDNLISKIMARILNWLLDKPNFPGTADILVKSLPAFFVEIQWQLKKSE